MKVAASKLGVAILIIELIIGTITAILAMLRKFSRVKA